MQFVSLHNVRDVRAEASKGRVTGAVCLTIIVTDAMGAQTEIKIFDQEIAHVERVADAINQRELELA